MATCLTTRPVYGPLTTNTPAWNGSARSNAEFVGSCYFGFEVPRATVGAVVGLNDDDTSSHYSEIQHGLYFSRGSVTVWELGVQRGPSAYAYDEGARFYIVRLGTSVLYCERPAGTPEATFFTIPRYPGVELPGAVIYASLAPSYGSVFLDASLYAVGDRVTNEVAGERWVPGHEIVALDPNAADAGGDLPLVGFSTDGSLEAAGVGQLPLSGTASSVQSVYVEGLLPFSGLASDIPLNTLIVGTLPLVGSADSGGVYLALAGAVGVFGLLGEASTTAHNVGAEGELPLAGFSTATSDAESVVTAVGYGEVPFTLSAASSAVLNDYFNIAFGFNAVPAVVQVGSITEHVDVSEVVEWAYTNNLRDVVQILSTPRNFSQRAVSATSEILAGDVHRNAFAAELTTEATVGDQLTFTLVACIVESLLANTSVENVYSAFVEIINSIVLADDVGAVRTASVADAISVVGTLTANRRLLTQVVSAMTLATTVENTLTIMVVDTAEVQVSDAVELTSQLLVELLDVADVYTLFRTSGDIAQGWAVNTEGTQPISEYDNFLFNSMTYFKGQLYATADAGVYTLEGDDDAGDPIMAQMASMMLDFGTSRLKRIRSAYMGYTAAKELVLKVRAESNGGLAEHWYKATHNGTAAIPDGSYMPIGQGLKSRYWQFELTNVDGGDFEVDKIELHPIILNRRV